MSKLDISFVTFWGSDIMSNFYDDKKEVKNFHLKQ